MLLEMASLRITGEHIVFIGVLHNLYGTDMMTLSF